MFLVGKGGTFKGGLGPQSRNQENYRSLICSRRTGGPGRGGKVKEFQLDYVLGKDSWGTIR